jgi:hypothetical protein
MPGLRVHALRRNVQHGLGVRFQPIHAVGLDGTANLAVLDGNLPPSARPRSLFSETVVRSAAGLVTFP